MILLSNRPLGPLGRATLGVAALHIAALASTRRQRAAQRFLATHRVDFAMPVEPLRSPLLSSSPGLRTRGHSRTELWEFAGWGSFSELEAPSSPAPGGANQASEGGDHGNEHKLGAATATAICGNDILSSCLYVSGLVALQAGKLAPISLFLVGCVLYLFRFVYGEVVSALPLNGGACECCVFSCFSPTSFLRARAHMCAHLTPRALLLASVQTTPC